MPFESSGCDVIDSTFNTTKPTRRIELQLSIHPDLVSFIAIESAAIKWKKGTKKKQNKRRAPPRSQDEERGVLIGYDDSSYLNMAPVNIEPTGTDAYWHRSRFSVVVVFFFSFSSLLCFLRLFTSVSSCFFASSHLVSSPFPSSLSVFFTDSYLVTELTAVHFLWLILFFFLVVPFLNFFGSW